MCDHQYLPLQKESQCYDCGQWFYHDLHHGPLSVRDREITEENITAQHQVSIVLACRILERRGQRFLVDFGWRNAEAMAANLLSSRPPETQAEAGE